MDEQFLLLFKAHEQRDVERFEQVNNALENIQNTLKPISDAFTSVSMLGRWGMGALVIVSLMVGIVISILKR